MDKLFESSKALSGLPKHWIKYLANRYGTGAIADLAGKHSELIPLKKFEKGLVSKMVKDENNLAVIAKLDNAPIFMIAQHPEKSTKYLFFTTQEGKGYYDNFAHTYWGAGGRRGRGDRQTKKDDFLFDEIYQFISDMQKDMSFDDLQVYAITKDPHRKKIGQERHIAHLVNKDPLEVPAKNDVTWHAPPMSVSQKERTQKYADSKKEKIDKRLDMEIQKIKVQISIELDNALSKITEDIRKGYTWKLDKKSMGQELLNKVNLDSISKLAELYKVLDVRGSDKDAMEVIKKLRSTIASKG